MDLEKHLIDLGFERKKEFDFEYEIGLKPHITPHYILKQNNKTLRAFIEKNNGEHYVILGIVVNKNGAVDRWRDCSAVKTLINNI